MPQALQPFPNFQVILLSNHIPLHVQQRYLQAFKIGLNGGSRPPIYGAMPSVAI
jgi:hypothetical protein